MCMVEDAEPWSFYTDTIVGRARREHFCVECRRVIHVGESYRKASGAFDGHFVVYKTCSHCLVAEAWLMEACNGYLFTQVREDLQEHWDDSESYRSPMLRLLIDGIR